ncbi:rCG62462 [Rattus norvegicus]|uniref:RCG62462 n=1 Tax=Rattus norvegicus TaxID=10116 RepID=A6J5S8_RAT|nr:rCG62462 [Rattus norvegicus]
MWESEPLSRCYCSAWWLPTEFYQLWFEMQAFANSNKHFFCHHLLTTRKATVDTTLSCS